MPLWQMFTTGVRFVTGRVNARTVLPAVLEMVGRGGSIPRW
jgi:hypothetical protein